MTSLFTSQLATAGFARVAVERGVDQYPEGLTYAVPAELGELVVGDRVIVPLGAGNTPTAGYVVERFDRSDLPPDQIKLIERREHEAAMPGQLIDLAKWISSYYCAPIGMTLAAMMPAAVKRRVGLVGRTMIDVANGTAVEVKLPPKQRHVLDVLSAIPTDRRPIEIRQLRDLSELATISPIKQLITKEMLVVSSRTAVEAAWIEHALDATVPQRLTEPQKQIIHDIQATLQHGFSAHLLFGVTGDGRPAPPTRQRIPDRRAGTHVCMHRWPGDGRRAPG